MKMGFFDYVKGLEPPEINKTAIHGGFKQLGKMLKFHFLA